MDSIEKCFEYNKGEFSLQTDISDELLLGFLSSSLQTFFEFENGTKSRSMNIPLAIKYDKRIIRNSGTLIFLSLFADLSFPLLSNIMKLKKWRCAYERET